MSSSKTSFRPLSVVIDEELAHLASGKPLSLEERMERAAQSSAIGSLDVEASKCEAKPNNLYAEHQGQLETLARKLYDIVPVAGPADSYGFVHPANAFKQTVDCDGLYMSDAEWQACSDALNALSKLWERQRTMQGMLIARNALLSVVLSDSELRDRAFAKAGALLDDCAETLERNGISLLG